jgi:hypothetical protein
MAHGLSTLAQAHWMRWLLVVAIVALYAGWIGYVVGRDKPLDFYVYYMAAYGFAKGEDIYSATRANGPALWDHLAQVLHITNYTYPYRYPPLTALIVWPLTFFPPQWASLIWLIASSGSFIASAWLLGRSSDSKWSVTLALAILLFFVPPLTTLNAGQVNGFLLLALAIALYGFAQRSSMWMGAGVAIGALLKLVPFVHLAYLGWRRQWQAMLKGLIVAALLFCLAIPLIGWQGVQSYASNFLSLGEAGGLFPSGSSQSMTSFFDRLLSPSGPDGHSTGNPQLALQLGTSASLVLGLATIALCWPIGNLPCLFALEFALVTVAANLITPFVWYHQLATLLLPFFVLAERAIKSSYLRWMLLPLTVGYVLTDLHGLIWHHLEPWPLLASTPFYTMLMLWGLLAWLIVRAKRSPVVNQSSPAL